MFSSFPWQIGTLCLSTHASICSTIEIKLKKEKGKEIELLSIQSDPENNPGGYLNQMTAKGESYTNKVEGDRHLKNRGMADHIK